MIEQLPLELHRSFRLLRELDETCTSGSKLVGLEPSSCSYSYRSDDRAAKGHPEVHRKANERQG